MRILHIIHSLDQRSGGPSGALRELVREQRAQGHRVAIIATDAQSAEPWLDDRTYRRRIFRERAFEGIGIFLCRGIGRRSVARRIRFSFQARRLLRRLFRNAAKRPHFVHIHGIFSHLTTVAARQCREHQIPYAVRPAGGLNPWCLRQGFFAGKRLLFRAFVREDMQRAAFVHATSEREAQHLAPHFRRQRIRVIPHGARVPNEEELERGRQMFRGRFPHFRGRPFVLYMSRLHPKKRLDLLLKAFAKLRRKHPDHYLMIAGSDAGYLNEAQRLASQLGLADRVRFVGFLSGSAKAGALALADVVVLPSEDENFGLVVVEALAHGTPVIASREVDSSIFIEESGAGVCVKGGVRELQLALEIVLSRDVRELGAKGRRFIAERLDWATIARRLDQEYRAHLGPAGEWERSNGDGS